jgi:hypothetical protein
MAAELPSIRFKARLRRAGGLRAARARRPRPLTNVHAYPVPVIPTYDVFNALVQLGSSVSYGDLPTWVVALATTGALVAAFRAALYTKRLFQTELARDTRTEQRDLRAQAEFISAWIVTQDQTIVGGFILSIDLQLRTALLNSSTQPIYNVKMTFSAGPVLADLTDSVDVLPPLTEFVERALPETAQAQLVARLQSSSDETLRVALEFTDAAGRRWLRAADGTLSQQIQDGPPP